METQDVTASAIVQKELWGSLALAECGKEGKSSPLIIEQPFGRSIKEAILKNIANHGDGVWMVSLYYSSQYTWNQYS